MKIKINQAVIEKIALEASSNFDQAVIAEKAIKDRLEELQEDLPNQLKAAALLGLINAGVKVYGHQ